MLPDYKTRGIRNGEFSTTSSFVFLGETIGTDYHAAYTATLVTGNLVDLFAFFSLPALYE